MDNKKVTAEVSKTGIGIGNALAIVISYTSYHSIPWAILHGFFGWFYVLYYLIKY